MSAFENGKETILLIWDLYFLQGMSKIQVHQESGLSRTTIDKYIKIIEEGLTDNTIFVMSECSPLQVEQLSSNLPSTYKVREKRISTPETNELIIKEFELWNGSNLNEFYRKFCSKHRSIPISYSTVYRIIKEHI